MSRFTTHLSAEAGIAHNRRSASDEECCLPFFWTIFYERGRLTCPCGFWLGVDAVWDTPDCIAA